MSRKQAWDDLEKLIEEWGIYSFDNYWSKQLKAQIKDMREKDVSVQVIYEVVRLVECLMNSALSTDPGVSYGIRNQEIRQVLEGIGA